MVQVGITTTAYGNNFGEFLQAWALRAFINKHIDGYQSELINFKCGSYSPLGEKYGLEAFSALSARKDRLFREFRETEIGLVAPPVNALTEKSAPDYDIYLFGSDGIWNTAVWEVPEFFGSFVPKGRRKVSYAASISSYPEQNILRPELFERWLPTFDAISIRERAHLDYVRRFVPNKDVALVCDPTLLHEKAEYERLIGGVTPPKPHRPYIFFYQPHAADCAILSLVVKLARRHGYDVVHTFADIPSEVFPHDAVSARFEGPREFLSYIRDAALVVTRSYHAAIFAILFGRPVYAYADKKTGARLESLFETLGMENRLIHTYLAPEDACLDYDYANPHARLAEFRSASATWLENALCD